MSFKEHATAAIGGFCSTMAFAGLCAGAAVVYVGAYIAVTTPLQAGLELAMNTPKREYVATLRDKRKMHLMQTHGTLDCGQFELPNGGRRDICDGPSVLEGKLFSDRYIHTMQPGQTYKIAVKGSDRIGYTLVDVVERKK